MLVASAADALENRAGMPLLRSSVSISQFGARANSWPPAV
jgi:hypothetical protein